MTTMATHAQTRDAIAQEDLLLKEPVVQTQSVGGRTAFLLGAGLFVSGIIGATGTTVSIAAPQVRHLGSWTSTDRAFDSSLVETDPAGGPREAQDDNSPLLSQDTATAPMADQEAVRWLHDESGLTWDQLGKLFGVSRRAVHLWANGGRMNARHAEILHELVAVVRDLDASTRDERRAALLALNAQGHSITSEFRARHVPGSGDVSGNPFMPDELVGAKHDDVAVT